MIKEIKPKGHETVVYVRCPRCEDGKIYFTECGNQTTRPGPSTVGYYFCPTCKGKGRVMKGIEV